MSSSVDDMFINDWLLAAIAIIIGVVMVPLFMRTIIKYRKQALCHPSYFVWWMIIFKIIVLFVILFQAIQYLLWIEGVYNGQSGYHKIATNYTCLYTGEIASASYLMYLWWMSFMVFHTMMLYRSPDLSFNYSNRFKTSYFIISTVWTLTYVLFLILWGLDKYGSSMNTSVGFCDIAVYNAPTWATHWVMYSIGFLRIVPSALFYIAAICTFIQSFLISRLPINTGHKIKQLSILIAVFFVYRMFEDTLLIYGNTSTEPYGLADDVYFLFLYLSFVVDYILWCYSVKTGRCHSQYVEIEEQQLLINKPSTNTALDKEFYDNIVTFTLMGILDTLTYNVEPHLLPPFRTLKISQTSMTFTDYNPFELQHLRRNVWDICDEEYKCSFQPPSDHVYNVPEGEQGLFTTHDGRYTIYMTTNSKFRFLSDIVNSYYRYSCSNPESLLSRITGLHSVKMLPLQTSINLVVLENISARAFTRSLYHTVLTNRVNIAQVTGPGVMLHPDHKERLVDVLEKDIMFLRDNDVVQYTIKVSIEALTDTDSTLSIYSLREGLPNIDSNTIPNSFLSLPSDTPLESPRNSDYSSMPNNVDTRTYAAVECFLDRWSVTDKCCYSIRRRIYGAGNDRIRKVVPPNIYAEQMSAIVKMYFK